MTKEEEQHLNQIRVDQANRLNDGWTSPKSPNHQLYLDTEFLLSLTDPDYPERFKDDEDEN